PARGGPEPPACRMATHSNSPLLVGEGPGVRSGAVSTKHTYTTAQWRRDTERTMEQQTDIQTRLTRGDTLLKEGDLRGAAEEFANAARAEPNNPGAHLGLAEAS